MSTPRRGERANPGRQSGNRAGGADSAWRGGGERKSEGFRPGNAGAGSRRKYRTGTDTPGGEPRFRPASDAAAPAARRRAGSEAERRTGSAGAAASRRASTERSGTPLGRRPDRRGSNSEPAATTPPIPHDADPALLDRAVRAELRSLSKPNAELVARHLVAAGQLLDVDPRRALEHARAARARAARVAAVREAVGLAAYHAGEWAEALTELRTARRISGDPRNLPVIADCERALGRADQAARLLNDPDARRLDPETRTELLIVVAGARRDRGQLDAALAVLARGGLDRERPRPGAARLWYAYADALLEGGRREEAASWFAASAAVDPEGELDAADRAAALL